MKNELMKIVLCMFERNEKRKDECQNFSYNSTDDYDVMYFSKCNKYIIIIIEKSTTARNFWTITELFRNFPARVSNKS